MKKCTKCLVEKPADDFYKVKKPDGGFRRHSKCKACHRASALTHYHENAEVYQERNLMWRSDPKNKERMQRSHRKNTYDLSDAEFKRMKKAQDNACAICTFKSKLYVDHDHATGKRRELLCNSCNVILGHAKDDPKVLTQRGYSAHAAYITKHHTAQESDRVINDDKARVVEVEGFGRVLLP